MESNNKSVTVLVVLASTLLSAIAWWFGTGLAPVPWLAWAAPLPLLLIAPRLRWQTAALAAACAGACAGLNLWHYVHDVIRLPLAVNVVIAAVPGLKFALSLLLYRGLRIKGKPCAAVLAFPAMWVALEYAASAGSPHGTFGSLAYSQIDLLPVVQLASVTGIWGVSFVMLLAPAAAATALSSSADRRTRIGASAAALLVVAATLGYGYTRLHEPAGDSVRVGLASLDGPVRPALTSAEGKALLERYLSVVDTLAASGARVIVLPETVFATDRAMIPAIAESALRNKVTIDIGLAVKDAVQGERNMALAFPPTGAGPAGYAKHHLIPGFESQYRPGTVAMLLGGSTTGLAICKDMDFHDTGRTYAALDANLLLVPAWDFGADAFLHSRMAVMLGIENGFAVARAALRGSLTLSDDRGRIIAEADAVQRDAQLVAALPLHRSHTLYAQWGDWFAWLDLALLALAFLSLGAASTMRRRTVAHAA